MRKFIFVFALLAASLPATPSVEQRTFEVLATSGSRAVVIKEFFSEPFKAMPKRGACFVEIVKPGAQNAHGLGDVQDYSLMWVQIVAEVGEKVTWTCKGEK